MRAFYHDLLNIRESYGPESIIGFVSSNCSNEAAYLFHKFIRGCIGSNNILTSESFLYPWDPLYLIFSAFDEFIIYPQISQLKDSSLVLILSSASLPDDPQILECLQNAKTAKNSKIVVFGLGNPQYNELTDIHFQVPDIAVNEIIQAILWLVHTMGGTDRQVIWQDNDTFQKILKRLRTFEPRAVAEKWSLDLKLLEKTASLITQKRSVSAILSHPGFADRIHCEAVLHLINLMVASGHFESKTGGIHYFPSGKNTLGVNFFGCQPCMFPGLIPTSSNAAWNWFLNSDYPQTSSLYGDIKEIQLLGENGVIKAIIWLGSPPWFQRPPHIDLDAFTECKLIVGASSCFDPKCNYWFPISPSPHKNYTQITSDWKLQFSEIENRGNSMKDPLPDDWELVLDWISIFNNHAKKIEFSGLWQEISQTIPCLQKHSSDKALIAMPGFFQKSFLDCSIKPLDREVELLAMPKFIDPSDYLRCTPMDTDVLLMVRNKKNNSEKTAGDSVSMSEVLLSISRQTAARFSIIDTCSVEVCLSKTSFFAHLHFEESIPEGYGILYVDNSWYSMQSPDLWSRSLTAKLIPVTTRASAPVERLPEFETE